MARKQRIGVVQSDRMDKTVVVMVERTVTHPLYKKIVRRRKKYQAHDEANDCSIGDKVVIEECRPISKNKHWRVMQIIERREVADVQPRDIVAPPIEVPDLEDSIAAETDHSPGDPAGGNAESLINADSDQNENEGVGVDLDDQNDTVADGNVVNSQEEVN